MYLNCPKTRTVTHENRFSGSASVKGKPTVLRPRSKGGDVQEAAIIERIQARFDMTASVCRERVCSGIGGRGDSEDGEVRTLRVPAASCICGIAVQMRL